MEKENLILLNKDFLKRTHLTLDDYLTISHEILHAIRNHACEEEKVFRGYRRLDNFGYSEILSPEVLEFFSQLNGVVLVQIFSEKNVGFDFEFTQELIEKLRKDKETYSLNKLKKIHKFFESDPKKKICKLIADGDAEILREKLIEWGSSSFVYFNLLYGFRKKDFDLLVEVIKYSLLGVKLSETVKGLFDPSSALINETAPYFISRIAIYEKIDEIEDKWHKLFLMSSDKIEKRYILPVKKEVEKLKKKRKFWIF